MFHKYSNKLVSAQSLLLVRKRSISSCSLTTVSPALQELDNTLIIGLKVHTNNPNGLVYATLKVITLSYQLKFDIFEELQYRDAPIIGSLIRSVADMAIPPYQQLAQMLSYMNQYYYR